VGSSAASASAESAGQEALGEQLAALDQKLSAANAAQASWLEQQLAQVSADTSAKISEVELSAQTLALEAEGKAMDAVSATVSTAVAEFERSIETAAAGMEEGVAGVRLPSNSLHACRCKHHAHAAHACSAGCPRTDLGAVGWLQVDERITIMEEGMEAGIGERCDDIQGELDQFSSIVLAMKGGQDATRDKLVRCTQNTSTHKHKHTNTCMPTTMHAFRGGCFDTCCHQRGILRLTNVWTALPLPPTPQATHEAQLEEFEATRQIVEESVAASNGDIELLKQEFTSFTKQVEGTTEKTSSLVARMLATEEENYDTVLTEANFSSVVEYNRAASRRCVILQPRVFTFT
jgi:hypothetical protein